MIEYIPKFAQKMIRWHKNHGRHDLPWQKNMTPYRIWISEIMLQQTQVATVIPYFQRFISTFPSITHVANAPLNDVIKLWAGLGYYSRAKHLHQTAKCIESDYKGKFPNTLDELIKLPGIGRSTAGAILAFAFNQRAAILDGNVKRIFIRLHGLKMTMQSHGTQKILWELAEHYLPRKNIQSYIQSLMDLGATLCLRKKPRCDACPLIKHCTAYQNQDTHRLPLPTRRKKLPTKEVFFLILKNEQSKILLEKRPPVGIWSHLWSFPEIKKLSDLQMHLKEFGLKKLSQTALPTFKHTFSHFHLNITPLIIQTTPIESLISDTKQIIWIFPKQFSDYGLPKPTNDLLKSLT
jgi:A/G-specific adenine glycosylase